MYLVSSSVVNVWFWVTEYCVCKQNLHSNVDTECTFKIRILNVKRSQICGSNLGIDLLRASHPCLVFQGCIVLFWFFFFFLGHVHTSTGAIWNNSLVSNKHKFQLVYCLLWVAALEFWICINSPFYVLQNWTCCTSLWHLLWLCYCNSLSKVTTFLLIKQYLKIELLC